MINTNVYNHYAMTYLPKTNTKYDTHKSKELRDIYQSMVRHNKQSPLYKLSMSESTQNYALSIKDAAIDLKNISSFLSDDQDTVFNKKVFTSSNDTVVDARLNTDDYSKVPEQLNIKIHDLATSQLNIGRYVPAKNKSISSGNYEVQLSTPKKDFLFSLKVSSATRNVDVQQTLADAINSNPTGLKASIIANEENPNQTALMIESQMTGESSRDDGLQFTFSEENRTQPIITYLGLNQIENRPRNSSFSINGEEHNSNTNHISINSIIEVDLLKASDESISLKMAPDTEEILSKVDDFVQSYNHLVSLANDNLENQRSARKLLTDISKITRKHANVLEANGLQVNEKGYIETETSLLTQSAKNGEFQNLFNDISDFKSDIISTTDQLNLDPLAYVDKVIVTYPNTSKSLPNPYMPSMYSGLLFNGYA